MKLFVTLLIFISFVKADSFIDMYKKDCIGCHKDGEVSVYDKSRQFSKLSEKDIYLQLKKYQTWDQKDDLGALMRVFVLKKSDEELILLAKGSKNLIDYNISTILLEIETAKKENSNKINQKSFLNQLLSIYKIIYMI